MLETLQGILWGFFLFLMKVPLQKQLEKQAANEWHLQKSSLHWYHPWDDL